MNAEPLRPVAGGLFALGSAFLWAVASILWSRLGREVSSLAMNLGKGVIALVCLGLAFAALGFSSPTPRALLFLGLSGLFGIALGDTLYFLSLLRLGPRRALLLTTLIPVVASFLATGVLGERLTARGYAGAALCLAGVAWVLRERLPAGPAEEARRSGVWFGLGSVLFCGVSVILSKLALAQSGAMEASFVRLAAGTAGLLAFMAATGRLGPELAPFRRPALLCVLLCAAFVGTFLGIWFSLLALDLTSATAATILNATSPIFILPLAVLVLGERLTLRSVLGACVAVAGAALLLVS